MWLLWLPAAAMVAIYNRGGLLAMLTAGAVILFLRLPQRWLAPIFFTPADRRHRLSGSIRRWTSARAGRCPSRQFVENFTSIVSEGDSSALEGTKEFRLRWWGDIINYTINGPYFWTGKGFGVNLADDDGFQVYADHSLRAPHNGHIEILARTGVPGLILWILMNAAIGIGLLRAAARARAHGADPLGGDQRLALRRLGGGARQRVVRPVPPGASRRHLVLVDGRARDRRHRGVDEGRGRARRRTPADEAPSRARTPGRPAACLGPHDGRSRQPTLPTRNRCSGPDHGRPQPLPAAGGRGRRGRRRDREPHGPRPRGRAVHRRQRSISSVRAGRKGRLADRDGLVAARRPGACPTRSGRSRPSVVHIHNTFPLLSPAIYGALDRTGTAIVQSIHNYRAVCPSANLFRDGHNCTDCVGRRFAWPAIVHACYRESRRAIGRRRGDARRRPT